MNIVIPMAGEGRRFSEKGFNLPKPLIVIKNNKTIVEYALESLNIQGEYIFIVKDYSDNKLNKSLEEILKNFNKDCKIIKIKETTDGPARTSSLAIQFIDNEDELLITNCDQYTNWNSEEFLGFARANHLDGCVAVYPYEKIVIGEKSPYSFIEVDSNKTAVRFEEKLAISTLSLNGIHYWKKGCFFIQSAKELFESKDKVNNEFYVSKTFNFLIKRKLKIGYYEMKKGTFFSLGTPEDVASFLKESLQ